MYEAIAGSTPNDRFRATTPDTPFLAAVDLPPRPLRIGWSTRPVTLGVRPDPQHVSAVRQTAELLAALGHRVREVDPGYPDPTAAFVPQFIGGVQAEADQVEHAELLERRTRQTLRLGSWVRPAVVAWGIRQGEKVAAKANRVFEESDLLLTPAITLRPPRLGALDGAGTVTAALRAMPMIAYTALWNVTGNPVASVRAGIGSDGLPLAEQLVGRPDDEATILNVAAQLEKARP